MPETPNPAPPVDELVAVIERRTTYLVRQFLLAVEALFSDPNADTFRTSPTLSTDITLRSSDLNRFAPQWAELVPPTAASRAAVFYALSQRYRLKRARAEALRAVLHLETPEVQAAFQAQTGQPLESAFVEANLPPTDSGHTTSQLNFIDLVVQHDIQSRMEWRFLPRGAVLFEEGDPGDSLYIIANGNVRIEKRQADGSHQLLAERGVGHIIGEMAVITEDTRTASVVASRDTELIRFTQADFNTLTAAHPQIMLSMAQIIITRFRETMAARPVTRQIKTVAFLPLGQPQPDFVQRVALALRQQGSALHLSHNTLDEQAYPGALAALDNPHLKRSVITWLNEAEERYDYILFEADPDPTAWTERALLQADLILLVAPGNADPAPYPLETHLHNTATSRISVELLLLYPSSSTTATNTAAWLAARPELDDYYNVHDTDAGAARVARRIAGKMVGLVFGGGALRAYAHGGVYAAMLANGVPLDYAGGTSAGAIAAALAALGMKPPEMRAKVEQGLTNFMDYTLPFVALTAGKRITHNLQAIFGDQRIEDLFVKFYCVSTNASTAREVIHTRGLLWRALRASASLPGIFPPLIAENDEGDLLVDGAVLNNVPTDIMRARCPGIVIAVDVSEPKRSTGRRYNHGDYVSGLTILLNRLNPFRRKRIKGPNMARFLSRLTYISSMKDRAFRHHEADLVILPDVAEYSIFDTGATDVMFAAGEAAATAALDEWQSTHPGWHW